MILPAFSPSDNPHYYTGADLAGLLPEDAHRRVMARTYHTALDGSPSVADDDLLVILMEVSE